MQRKIINGRIVIFLNSARNIDRDFGSVNEEDRTFGSDDVYLHRNVYGREG